MQRCPEPSCGHLNRPAARFCQRCGRSLSELQWSALHSGQMLRGDDYRILEPLGKGGMGALYLAADTRAFHRRCVIKELLEYYDPSDPQEARQAQARFETEARLLAELSHPGIPRIYSYFSEAGRHYIVMEYIEGETLERAVTHVDAVGCSVAARRLAGEEIVRHAVRICQVLEYLADRPTPVIHHDIKPANLIVDRASAEVRLVDFGTAKFHGLRAGPPAAGPRQASAFGTHGYAAPEQYQGHPEPRSDVYALAATVYHLLTDDDPGDHPFQFPQMGTLPGPLAAALARALRPEPHRRSTAVELRHAFQAWLIPDESAQPFVFRSGAVAHTTEELAALCDLHWSEARQHLVNGDFDQWFRARSRHDLVARSQSARLQRNADAALEEFLRRLNPRLAPPKLTIEPDDLAYGRLTRTGPVACQLVLRNLGRGYGQVTFGASVPWIDFDPDEVGCLAGTQSLVTVWLNAAILPLRRDHQAVITCTLARGTRISIPVTAELSPAREILLWIAVELQNLARLSQLGARRGLQLWMRTVRSLLHSRYGPWVLAGEVLLLLAVMVVGWWSAGGLSPSPGDLFLVLVWALPLTLLGVCLAPALAFVGGGIAWEIIRAVVGQLRT